MCIRKKVVSWSSSICVITFGSALEKIVLQCCIYLFPFIIYEVLSFKHLIFENVYRVVQIDRFSRVTIIDRANLI